MAEAMRASSFRHSAMFDDYIHFSAWRHRCFRAPRVCHIVCLMPRCLAMRAHHITMPLRRYAAFTLSQTAPPLPCHPSPSIILRATPFCHAMRGSADRAAAESAARSCREVHADDAMLPPLSLPPCRCLRASSAAADGAAARLRAPAFKEAVHAARAQFT